jgi:hypothetical protein
MEIHQRVPGWHNFEPDMRMIQAQLIQIIAQSTALSKAISEVLCTVNEEVSDGNSSMGSR